MQPPLFEDTPPPSPSPSPQGGGVLTCFGEKVDKLARERGGWPANAVVYMIEGINREQAMLTGQVPIGPRKKDPERPQFPPKKANAPTYRVVIPIADWRALFDRSNGPSKDTSE